MGSRIDFLLSCKFVRLPYFQIELTFNSVTFIFFNFFIFVYHQFWIILYRIANLFCKFIKVLPVVIQIWLANCFYFWSKLTKWKGLLKQISGKQHTWPHLLLQIRTSVVQIFFIRNCNCLSRVHFKQFFRRTDLFKDNSGRTESFVVYFLRNQTHYVLKCFVPLIHDNSAFYCIQFAVLSSFILKTIIHLIVLCW